VLEQELQRQELLEYSMTQLLKKASTLNRETQAEVKEINDLQEVVNKLAFPENYTKTKLPEVEFKSKIKKLDSIQKKFPANYRKIK
jgi:hypothetical protein